ncbi:MAG: PTS sugar transporter subunit IIC [Humidesulfovibrio sp.]|uniref:PTS sugar transporter subunit IIC n=1 Tax=Humidesulfovibrio sp. TaxID=2910988 RepID=UPI0027358D4C|nr:PTS sugar transporter subunit IIC [Humidesulfovibrio sp.]MDP2848002.1 PTS sugar transporter subunit IIC [Humidesulfovibrio sp.]
MVRHDWFFFALFSLFRFSVSIGLFERPLVVGLLWGVFVGDLETSLQVAIFYELLWLDFIPVGTFIPPHMTAATFTALLISNYYGLDTLPLVSLALLAGLPMAWFGTRLERTMRDRLNRSYGGVLQWVRKPLDTGVPGRLLIGTLASKVMMNWLFFMVGAGGLALLTGFALRQYGPDLASLKLTWSQLLIASSVGGLLALRLRSLYLSVAAGAFALGILRFLGIF